jgi:exodeoxyribonuclease VII large subunit
VARRGSAPAAADRLRASAAAAVGRRGRRLAELARVPAERVGRERARLHQQLREIRAAGGRQMQARAGDQRRIATVLERKAEAGAGHAARAVAATDRRVEALRRAASADGERRRAAIERAAVALRAHDPERTLERGYALVEDPGGEPLTSVQAAVRAATVTMRFADGRIGARVDPDADSGSRPAESHPCGHTRPPHDTEPPR